MGNEISNCKNHSLNFKGVDFARYNFEDDSEISLLVTTLMASISPPIKCISIQQCNMQQLPPLSIIEQSFGVSEIRTCYICENGITQLQSDFCKLTALKELSLSANKFQDFDKNLFFMEKIQRLSIDRNEIKGEFPPKSPVRQELSIYKTLLSIDASFNQITKISPEISRFSSLEQLNFSNNDFHEFPSAVCELKKLRVLDLSNNSIQKIPSHINKMESLIILKLHSNSLQTLPQEITTMASLSELTLYSNKLDFTSEIIQSLASSLVSLNLGNSEDQDDEDKKEAASKVQKVKKLLQTTNPTPQSPSSPRIRDSLNPIGEFEIAFKSVLASFDDNDKIKLQMKKLSLEEKWLLLQQKAKQNNIKSTRASRPINRVNTSFFNRSSILKESNASATNNNNNTNNNIRVSRKKSDFDEKKLMENHISHQREEDEIEELEEEKNLTDKITTQIFAISDEAPVHKDCKYYINQLKSQISLQDVQFLYDELINNGDEYIQEFLDLGGSNLLLLKLKEFIYMEENFSDQLEFLQLELLKCYNIIFQSRLPEIIHNISEKGVKDELLANSPSNTIEENALRIVAANGGWKKAQSNEQSINLQILSLQMLLSASNVAHPSAVNLVIDAFDFVKKHIKTDESRFQNLLLALSEDPNVDESLRVSLQSTALSLINGLIDGTNELKSRCGLRKELFNLNLEQKLGDLKIQQVDNEEFQGVLNLFLESMDDDFEEVFVREGIEEVLNLRPNLIPRPNDCLLVLPLITGSVSSSPIVVPFDQLTTINDIFAQLNNLLDPSFNSKDKDVALFIPKINDGLWLTPKKDGAKLLSSYSMTGEIIVEYKLRPWDITLIYLNENDAEQQITVHNIDPNSVINDVLFQFLHLVYPNVKNLNSDNYTLFVPKDSFLLFENNNYHHNAIGGSYLLESQRFSSYQLNSKKKEKIIILKEKPIPVNFNISEGIQEVVEVDPSLFASELFQQLVKKVNVPPSNILQYQLYLERRGNEEELSAIAGASSLSSSNPLSLRTFNMGTHRALENIKRYSCILSPVYRVPIDHSVRLRKLKLTHEDTIVIGLTPNEARLRANRRTIYYNKNDEINSPLSPMGKRASILTKHIPREAVQISDSDSERKMLVLSIETQLVDLKFANVIDIRNIWEEPTDGNIELKKDGAVKAATLNQLVTTLTEHQGDFDRKFADAFFTTCPTFCTPNQLFAKITERYEPGENMCDEESKKLVRMRVLLAIGTWIDHNPHLFISNNSLINSFFELCKYDGYSDMINSMKQKALLAANVKNPLHFIPKSVVSKVSLLDADPLELAKQICIKTYSTFAEIQSEELVGQAWSKSDGKERAKNVISCIDTFNYYSRWVSSNILHQEKVRMRAKVFNKMIEIAMKLLSLNNFQILMAFISGFNVCAVSRLKWTQAKLSKQSKKSLTRLEQIMSMEGSFRNYRELISKSEPPGIPYLGVYLQDITFIEDGNLDYVVAHMINFEKRWMLYDVISKIRRFQKHDYRFKPVPHILHMLDTCPIQTDEELYRVSLLREPRNATRGDID